MTEAPGVCIDGDALRVSGDLRVMTAGAAHAVGRQAIDDWTGTSMTIDMSAAVQVSTATIAVLCAWMRAARGRGIDVQVAGVSAALRDVADFSGVTELLGTGPADGSTETPLPQAMLHDH